MAGFTPEYLNVSPEQLEKFHLYFTVIILLPAYYWVYAGIGLPKLLQLSYVSPQTYYFLNIFGIYNFINIAGNLALSYLTDTRVKNYNGPGIYCEKCKQNRSADDWHCNICNACIIRRDHHCCFLSHCIGRKNIRYFICMLGHIAITMAYCTIFNTLYIFSELNFLTIWKCFMIFTRPGFIVNDGSSFEDMLFVLTWFIDLFVLPSSMIFFIGHMSNAVLGLTANERVKGRTGPEAHWTSNMEYVFGTRWYLALLWPFVDSNLPDKR